jgi:hypothetical protein
LPGVGGYAPVVSKVAGVVLGQREGWVWVSFLPGSVKWLALSQWNEVYDVARTSSKNKDPAINPTVDSAEPARHGNRYGYFFRRGNEPNTEG